MAMERFMITMSSNDIDNFERGRSAMGMSKSAYVRLLIAEHENKVPGFILNRELIAMFARLDADMKKAVLVKDVFSDKEKMLLYEEIRELKNTLCQFGTK